MKLIRHWTRAKKIWIGFIILFIALSCIIGYLSRSHTRDSLLKVEELIELYPDSAVTLLESIPMESKLSREDDALYALLRTRAEYKQNGYVSSNSLVDHAMKYYTDSHDSLRWAQTLYFKAKYLADFNRNLEAVEPATLARDYFAGKDLPLWKARVAQLFGFIHGMEYDFNNAAAYNKEAANEFVLAGKPRNHLFSLVDYAQQLCFLEQDENGLRLLDSIRNVAMKVPVDSMLLNYTDRVLIEELLEVGDFSKAERIIEEQSKLGRYHRTSSEDLIRRIYLTLGQDKLTEAKTLLDEFAEDANGDVDKANLFLGYKYYFKNTGDYKKSLQYSDSLQRLQDKTLVEKLRQSIPMIQLDGYRHQADIQQSRNYRLRLIVIMILVAFVILVIFAIGWYIMRERLRMTKLQMILESNRDLENQTIAKEKENSHLEARLKGVTLELENVKRECNEYQEVLASTQHEGKQQLENLLKSSWDTMDFLCGQYYDYEEAGKSTNMLLKKLTAEIKRFQSSKYLEQVEEKINVCTDGVASMFREECSFLSAKEMSVGILTFSGMSVKSICLLLGMTRDNLHVTKSRIINKLEHNKVPHASLFIDKLYVKRRPRKVDGHE